ncbi:MAG: helix-turn-helix domain-containing protein [Candidatus Dormibacteria bacterium]
MAPTSSPGRLTPTVEEAAALLGIGRAFAYYDVRRGEIPSIRIGRRVLVPRVALGRLVRGAGEAPPTPTEWD